MQSSCKSWGDCTNPHMDCVNCPFHDVTHAKMDYLKEIAVETGYVLREGKSTDITDTIRVNKSNEIT